MAIATSHGTDTRALTNFFKINKGFAQPKPIQKPFPPIMNAGGSPRGQ